MTDTPWFLLRDDLAGGGPAGASPDIILGGAKPDPRYTTDYDTAFNAAGDFAGTNQVYVRARNTDTAQAIGNVSVSAVRLDNLHDQTRWAALSTRDRRTATTISAAAGGVGVNRTPLLWEPGAAPDPDAPWCLVAEIVGDDHPPVDVPDHVTDRSSFDAWIAGEPRMAYLIVQQPEKPSVEVPGFGWSQKVHLANADAATLEATLTCTASSGGGFLAFRFDKPDSAGRAIGIGRTEISVYRNFSQTREVPAGFTSTVNVAYTPPDSGDAEADFTFEVATITESGDSDDLDPSERTVIASYALSFGQARATKA